MTAVNLPPDLEAWARAEVDAGRAESVDALVARALRARRELEELRRSLDEAEAEADRDGAMRADDVFDRLERRFPTS